MGNNSIIVDSLLAVLLVAAQLKRNGSSFPCFAWERHLGHNAFRNGTIILRLLYIKAQNVRSICFHTKVDRHDGLETVTREVVAALAEKGIKVTEGLVYFNKGRIKGRKSRRQKAGQMAAKVTATTGSGDAVTTILKLKAWALEVGGLKKLKALVDALSE